MASLNLQVFALIEFPALKRSHHMKGAGGCRKRKEEEVDESTWDLVAIILFPTASHNTYTHWLVWPVCFISSHVLTGGSRGCGRVTEWL